jgi:hypothetical protein
VVSAFASRCPAVEVANRGPVAAAAVAEEEDAIAEEDVDLATVAVEEAVEDVATGAGAGPGMSWLRDILYV